MSQKIVRNLTTAVLATGLALGGQQAFAWAIDFENVGLQHGEVLNTEQASGFTSWTATGTANSGSSSTNNIGVYATGVATDASGATVPKVEIRANNGHSGDNESEFAVAFDTTTGGLNSGPDGAVNGTGETEDPDLEADFNGPFYVYTTGAPAATSPFEATLDGGVESGTYETNNGLAAGSVTNQLRNPGTVAIVQEEDEGTYGNNDDTVRFPGCYNGICDSPDDEYNSGTSSKIIFDFDTAVTLTSIDVFDIEAGSEQAGRIDFWDADGLMACVHFPVTGNNGAARIIFNGGNGFENVILAKVTLNGSGAIDNLTGQAGGTNNGAPEPATLGLLGLGLFGMRYARRRAA